MDGILGQLESQAAWEEFLAHRLMKGRFNWPEFEDADAFVAGQEYLPAAQAIIRGEGPGVPVRKCVNKMGTGKKRTVYSYGADETRVLKLLSHLLYRYDSCFAPNCYSFRRGLKASDAIFSILRLLHGRRMWAYKLDIHDYFGQTDHQVAIQAVNKRIDDPWIQKEVKRIIESFGDGKGIGLGSQVSQLIQLAVLDDIDHFITEELEVPLYVRYMDDFILIHESKEHLRYCLNQVRKKLQELKLDISPKKTQIFKVTQPIKFLGFTFMLHGTGKVTWRLLPKNIKREKRKITKLAKLVKAGKISMAKFDECYQCWRAHAKKSDSRYSIRKLDKYQKQLKEELVSWQENKQ